MNRIGFFQEAPGEFSMTRLLVFLLIVYAILMSAAVGGVELYRFAKTAVPSLLDIVTAMGAFLGSITALAAGFKLIAKGQEKQEETKAIK